MRRLLALLGLGLLACGPLPDEEVGATPPGGKADDPAHQAPGWLLAPLGSGTFNEPDDKGDLLRAWVDARVQNRRFHKRLFVEVAAPYGGQRFLRTLHPAWFKASLGGGQERWGVDTVEIYPTGGPHGASLSGPVLFRLRLQEDPDGDGKDQMVVTAWQRLHGTGPLAPPVEDPWAPGWSSPALASGSAPPPQVYFTPFDDAGLVVAAEIDQVIARQAKNPQGRHTLHAAIFNINDPRIVDRLIAAHQSGVEVRLVTDAGKLRPSATWQTEDDRLITAGVPLLGVRRRGRGAMHDKLCLFDGRKLSSGSFNWELGSSRENHENMLLTEEPALVRAYAERFAAVAGEVQLPRSGATDPAARLSASFAPDEAPYRIAGALVDSAVQKVELAMFTCKDVSYQEGGRPTSLFEKLVAAVGRGVEVTLLTDFGVSEASEYFGQISPDDPADEWLEDRGVHVVRADNGFGPYASMHHKFVVVDEKALLTGAFNWYHDAAYLNDEDQMLWRDPLLAREYRGELADLLRRYDPAFQPAAWPQAKVRFTVQHAGTQYGDTVAVVGDLPELGSWNPQKALRLEATSWPTWSAPELMLPAGVRAEYKLVVLRAGGAVSWQPGPNRRLRAPTDGSVLEEKVSY